MRSGLMVENLTPQLGEFFWGQERKWSAGAVGGKKAAAADKAGLRPGDVITRWAISRFTTPSDFTHALRESPQTPDPSVVGRDRDTAKEQTLTLTLPDARTPPGD